MKNNLKISISKKPTSSGIVAFKEVCVREKILRWLLGEKQRVMIILPSETLEEVEIVKVGE